MTLLVKVDSVTKKYSQFKSKSMNKETLYCNAMRYSFRGRITSALWYGIIGYVIGLILQEFAIYVAVHVCSLFIVIGLLFPSRLFYMFGLMHPTTMEISDYSRKLSTDIENTIEKNNKRVSSINSHNERLREIKTQLVFEKELP